jgi:hypothetical protein
MLDKRGDWAMRRLLFAIKPATRVLWAATVLVMLGLAPAVGRADVILGNLTVLNGSNQAYSQNGWFAASFTMGSQDYSLSAVVLALNNASNSTIITLQANATGTPASHPSGTNVLSFINPTLSGNGKFTFTPSTPNNAFRLNANTTYWLVARTSGGSTGWVRSNPVTTASGTGATFGNYASSNNAGGAWAIDTSNNAPQFQLNGTLAGVPEPSSLVLVGTVACVAGALRLRRRRTRPPEPDVETAPSADGT